jgi:hypothetical protein
MAVTAALVFTGNNRLRYLLTQDGGAGTTLSITSSGAATPDLLTDSIQGPIKKLAKTPSDGYGLLAAGALTQAQARALWLSNPQSTVEIAGSQLPTAVIKLNPRSGVGPTWRVDANVSGGVPTLDITAQAVAGTCYMDVEVLGPIGA